MLICEDQPQVAEVLAAVLRSAGFDAKSLPRVEGVIDVLLQESVAVLLISFSGLDALVSTALVAQLRGRPEPALNQSGIVMLSNQGAAATSGADTELGRPVQAQQLVDAVTEVAATSSLALELRRNADHTSG